MKTPMITRTFTTTNATLLCLDTKAAEPMNRDLTLAGHYDDEGKLLKDAKKALETETLVVCKVVHVTETTEIRGMTCQKFLELSDVIPSKETTGNN